VLSIAAVSFWPTICAASLRFRLKRQSWDQTRLGWQRCKLRLREHCEAAAQCGAGDSGTPAWITCLADQSAAVTLVQLPVLQAAPTCCSLGDLKAWQRQLSLLKRAPTQLQAPAALTNLGRRHDTTAAVNCSDRRYACYTLILLPQCGVCDYNLSDACSASTRSDPAQAHSHLRTYERRDLSKCGCCWPTISSTTSSTWWASGTSVSELKASQRRLQR
jgi:hypothetical protein